MAWPGNSVVDTLCAHSDAPVFTLAGITVPALVVECHDADSFAAVLEVDGRYYRFAIRVLGIDSPEMTDKDAVVKAWALRARNRLLSLLAPGTFVVDGEYTHADVKACLGKAKPVVCLTLGKMDKYGRLLADVRPSPGAGTFQETLLAEGFYKPYGRDGNLTKDVWTADQCGRR